MSKKIPKVFANAIKKPLKNNADVYYSSREEKVKINNKINKSKKIADKSAISITKKIANIFASPNYVYKADVKITLASGVLTKRIVGRTSNDLITIENDLIPIKDIIDIEFVE